MADQACHAVGSTTQVGLTQALGLMTDIHPLFFVALIVLLGWLGLTGIKTLARSRSLSARRLLFVVGVVFFLALAGGASLAFVWAEQNGVIPLPGPRCGGIGKAHVCTPCTNSPLLFCLLLVKKKNITNE